MELHISNVQEGFNLEEYKCQECNRNFTTNGSLKSHQIVHDQNRIRYECNKCQKSFSHETELVMHIKSIHEGKRFVCKICNKEFTQDGNMKRHIISVHEITEKLYECSSCSKFYSNNSHFRP